MAEARDYSNGKKIVSVQDPQDPKKVHDVRLFDKANADALMDYLREIRFDPEKAYPNRSSCRLER